MADICVPSAEQLNAWTEFLAQLPEATRKMAERFRPWKLYRLKSSNHRVTIISFSDDLTMSVFVGGEYNRVLFSRKVFGIAPGNLEECDLPEPGEDVGDTAKEAGYTEDDIKNILIPRLKRDREARRG